MHYGTFAKVSQSVRQSVPREDFAPNRPLCEEGGRKARGWGCGAGAVNGHRKSAAAAKNQFQQQMEIEASLNFLKAKEMQDDRGQHLRVR